MLNKPNVVLRGGSANGQIFYFSDLGDPMPFEDVDGSITYVDNDELEEHEGIQLRVYVPKV